MSSTAIAAMATTGLLLIAAITVNVIFMNKDGFLDMNPAEFVAGRGDYALLPNPKKPAPQVASGPTSQQCYEKDYQNTLDVLPSFRQMTNNYKHANGESCSAPNHDLILGIYA